MPLKRKNFTKLDNYIRLKRFVTGKETTHTFEQKYLLNFIDNEIETLTRKANNEKKRYINIKKEKQQPDELKDMVYEVLTNDFQTINMIMEQFEEEWITRGKVTARLSALCREKKAEKANVYELNSIDYTQKLVKGYKIKGGNRISAPQKKGDKDK